MSHIQIPWSHWLFTPFSSLTQFEKHAYILNMTNKTIDCLPAMQQKRSTQVPHLAIWLWFSTFSRTLSEPPATYVNWWILSPFHWKWPHPVNQQHLWKIPYPSPTPLLQKIPGNPTTAVLRCLRLRLRGPISPDFTNGKRRIIDSKVPFGRLIDIHSCCAFGEKIRCLYTCIYIYFFFYFFFICLFITVRCPQNRTGRYSLPKFQPLSQPMISILLASFVIWKAHLHKP